MRKRIAAILLPLLTGTVAVGLQNSKAKTADSGTAQPKSGSVGQLLMQIERDWGKAIIDRNIAKIREIVAPDVVLTTPDGSVQSLDDDVAELKSGAFTAESYDSFDMKVKLYGHCAVVTGKTKLKGNRQPRFRKRTKNRPREPRPGG